jgi:DNA replication and repair protein RecF
MTSAAYIGAAREYRRVLQQRNAALKRRAGDYEVNIWTEKIVAAGADLVVLRRDLAATLASEVHAHAEELHTSFDFELAYESTLLREHETIAAAAGDGETDVPALADVFAVKLGALEDEERRRCTTLAGPHRDDLGVRLDGRDLRKYGSQGQRRLFAVLLKVAELSHLEKQLNEPCVLLLDDVFSEFDQDITKQLQHLLDGARQVFVTSPVDLEWAHSENAGVYRVKAGTVEGVT